MKKNITILLLCAMVLSLAGCGETNTEETTADTTAVETVVETVETEPTHAVPELDFGGETYTTVYPGGWQGYQHYFVSEEATGDVMDDALYERQLFVEEFLNVDMAHNDVVNIGDVVTEVKKSVGAGDDVYSMALLHCITGVSELPTSGYLYNFDDLPYIDMEMPWWNKNQTDALRLGNKTFYGVSDYMIPTPYVIFFNKELVVNENLDDPYAQVFEGTWTLDSFVDMSIAVTRDLNGDGEVKKEDDIGGIAIADASLAIPLMTGAEQFITTKGDDGKIHLDMNNEKTVSIIEKVYRLVENKGTIFNTGYDTFDMGTGRVLFLFGAAPYAEDLRECEVDIGILPYPKYDEAQENYNSQDWGGLMCIPSTIGNPEMVGAVQELLAWKSSETVMPAYFDKTLAGKLARDEQTRKVLELIFDTISYEIGGNYFGFSGGFKDLFYTIPNLVITNSSTDFASWYAKNEKAANSTLDKFYEALDKVEAQ